MLHVTGLRCDHRDSPLTVGPESPWLSWRVEATGGERDVELASARVHVHGVWDSGPVKGGRAGLVYAGPPLQSFERYEWTAEVTIADGQVLASPPSTFETGPLDHSEWSARWIGLPRPFDQHDDHRPVPHLRRAFHLEGAPTRARLYVAAGGLHRLFVDGARIGADELTPGWTDFHQRVHYQAYDVTELLGPGDHVLGALVADGWFSGSIGPDARRGHYGDEPCLLAELDLWWPDGSRTSIGTDTEWTGRFGPVLSADLLMGEVHDARLELGRWAEPGATVEGWVTLTEVPGPTGRLLGQPCDPPRVVAELSAVDLSEPIPGSYVFDLGQNLVGHARLRLEAPAGTLVRLRHGEMCDPDGMVYTENLRRARCTDTYVAAGSGTEVFDPAFTFHGFRYVEVTGLASAPRLEDLTGVAVSSAAEQTGEFECSSPMLNRLQQNVRWGQLGNFLHVPTDCPQRDERMGWMGDAQVFAPTACFNAQVGPFFSKWLDDVCDAFDDRGFVTDVAPLPKLPDGFELRAAAPGWGDACAIVPWTAYQWYADPRPLQHAYRVATARVDRIHQANADLVWRNERGFDFGDWLSIDSDTPRDLLGTAYFALSARLVAAMADVLGRPDDAERYGRLADDVAAAFRAEYVDDDGRIAGTTQTAYALALEFDLLNDRQREQAAAHLAADIEERGGRLSTGFLGVAHLLPALSGSGQLDLAYRLLTAEHFPSWGYSIAHGATTIWERWDGWTEDRGFQTPSMNSLNHYCFGSVGSWIYAVLGGIRSAPDALGWERVVFEPRPGGGVEWAKVSYDSVRGRVAAGWRAVDDGFEADLTLPPGVTAEVRLPLAAGQAVTESGSAVPAPAGSDGVSHIDVGSGNYRFVVR